LSGFPGEILQPQYLFLATPRPGIPYCFPFSFDGIGSSGMAKISPQMRSHG
jgi:hypothetical protein